MGRRLNEVAPAADPVTDLAVGLRLAKKVAVCTGRQRRIDLRKWDYIMNAV